MTNNNQFITFGNLNSFAKEFKNKIEEKDINPLKEKIGDDNGGLISQVSTLETNIERLENSVGNKPESKTDTLWSTVNSLEGNLGTPLAATTDTTAWGNINNIKDQLGDKTKPEVGTVWNLLEDVPSTAEFVKEAKDLKVLTGIGAIGAFDIDKSKYDLLGQHDKASSQEQTYGFVSLNKITPSLGVLSITFRLGTKAVADNGKFYILSVETIKNILQQQKYSKGASTEIGYKEGATDFKFSYPYSILCTCTPYKRFTEEGSTTPSIQVPKEEAWTDRFYSSVDFGNVAYYNEGYIQIGRVHYGDDENTWNIRPHYYNSLRSDYGIIYNIIFLVELTPLSKQQTES